MYDGVLMLSMLDRENQILGSYVGMEVPLPTWRFTPQRFVLRHNHIITSSIKTRHFSGIE